MSKKIYRTAQGKTVDLGSLQVQNETVRAVGNMNVNARGDRLDADGNIIATRSQQVNRALNRQTNTSAGPIAASSRAQKEPEAAVDQTTAKEKLEQARIQRQARREAGIVPPEATPPAAGLAAAMARAAQQKDQE